MFVAFHRFHLKGCLGGVLAHGVQKLPKLHANASGSFVVYWNENKTDEVSYYQSNDSSEMKVDRDLGVQSWNRTRCVQFHLYQRPLFEQIRDDEPSDLRAEGTLAEEAPNDIEERTPITLSPEPSVGQVPSGGNTEDGGNSDVDNDTFWSDGMIAMRSEKNSSDIAFSHFEDQWNQIFMLDAPPDAEIIHEQVDAGYSFVPAFAERYLRQSALDFQQWTWPRDIDHEMERLD